VLVDGHRISGGTLPDDQEAWDELQEMLVPLRITTDDCLVLLRQFDHQPGLPRVIDVGRWTPGSH
jgi:hypothetical protein